MNNKYNIMNYCKNEIEKEFENKQKIEMLKALALNI